MPGLGVVRMGMAPQRPGRARAAPHTAKRTGLTQKPYWSSLNASKASNCPFDWDVTALRRSMAGKWCRLRMAKTASLREAGVLVGRSLVLQLSIKHDNYKILGWPGGSGG